jgi:hypothetical protein
MAWTRELAEHFAAQWVAFNDRWLGFYVPVPRDFFKVYAGCAVPEWVLNVELQRRALIARVERTNRCVRSAAP